MLSFHISLLPKPNSLRKKNSHSSMEESSSRKIGSTLKVPSVRELAKQELAAIPSRYIRDDLEKTSCSILMPQVPVIDMEKLLIIGDHDTAELERLHFACKEWGFFQVYLYDFCLVFELCRKGLVLKIRVGLL